jgi:hypothetical protein
MAKDSLATRGWQPKLSKIHPAYGSRPRPWVLIAEEHAPAAVQLLLNIMNGNYPIKVRMEAAAKVLMIAGTGFRGESRDAQGRPAANGTFKLIGGAATPTPNQELIRAALKTLPQGAVKLGPEEVREGEKVVMFHNPRYVNQAKTPENPYGGLYRGKPEGYKRTGSAEMPIVELETDEHDAMEEEAGYF